MSTVLWQPGMTLKDVEKQVITMAFRFFSGNKTQTANSLGIAIRTLDAKLEEYGLEKKDVSAGKEADLGSKPAAQAGSQDAVPVPEREAARGVLQPKAPKKRDGADRKVPGAHQARGA